MKRQFPCILKGSHIWLAFDKHNATTLDSDHGKNRGNINFEYDGFDNITAEYLANTYGEVKSKEHAEFIVKLAEVNGIPCGVDRIDMDYKVFYVIHGYLFFFVNEVNLSAEYKQITIPLPPECESEDEWLMVGSKALLNNDNGYELDYGENLIGKEVEVINLFTDGDLDMAVVKHDVANYCFRIEMLSKQKTKEEKDRDEIKEEIKEIFSEAMKSPFWFIYDSDEKAANYLLERFDITKKPQ